MPAIYHENGISGRTIRDIDGTTPVLIDYQEVALRFWDSNGNFIRVVAESIRNKRLRKTGNPYRVADPDRPRHPEAGREPIITKVACFVCKNNFRYHDAVRREVERNGGNPALVPFSSRGWGRHVRGSFHFTVHRNSHDNVNRLHPYLLPVRRHHAAWTGYYVDGLKIDDAELAPFENQAGEYDIVRAAKLRKKPWEPRLENVRYVKISGVFYRIINPPQAEVNALAEATEANEPPF